MAAFTAFGLVGARRVPTAIWPILDVGPIMVDGGAGVHLKVGENLE